MPSLEARIYYPVFISSGISAVLHRIQININQRKPKSMKKFYTATLALMVAVSAAAAPQIRQILPVKKAFKMSANLSASELKKHQLLK